MSGESIPLRDPKALGIDQVGSETRGVDGRSFGNRGSGVGPASCAQRSSRWQGKWVRRS